MHHVTFVETSNGPVAVVHAQPLELLDADLAARRRRDVQRLLGGVRVVQRCVVGGAVIFGGEQHLHRYAADPSLSALPVVTIAGNGTIGEAAA